MTDLRGAVLIALSALDGIDELRDVYESLRAALATSEPMQKPVAWMWQHADTGRTGFIEAHLANDFFRMNPRLHRVHPVYAHPAPPQTPMTDEQMRHLFLRFGCQAQSALFVEVVRAVERHHGIGPARGE
jgi:hypothetical protein